MTPSTSIPLAQLSPSRWAWLRRCPHHVALTTTHRVKISKGGIDWYARKAKKPTGRASWEQFKAYMEGDG